MLVLFFPAIGRSQDQGEIRLSVQDPSGAPMRAGGRLEGGRVRRHFQTDDHGKFVFERLPFGQYRIEVNQTGFTSQAIEVGVQSATPVVRTVAMQLGQQPRTQVEVVATTPLAGVNLEPNQLPSLAQTATQGDIEKSNALGLEDFLNRRMNGVYLNEVQGNPFQPDVNYRGYTASPLLGTPQGISVFLDGVRQNQPFGDVVSWDLIPQNAISAVTLISGSDPLFGLNTLGGALSVQTKDGLTNPGIRGRVLYGSSGRKSLQAEEGGGKATGFNWFLAANVFHESGWRFDSPSDIRQGFGRVGWKTDKTDLGLTLSYAYNTLTGNGLQDYRLLANDYSGVYTIPDTTSNRSPAFNFIARHTFSGKLMVSGNVYYRNLRTEVLNGNLNNASLDQSVYQPNSGEQAALQAAGYSGYPASGATAANTPYPKWRCIAQGILQSRPDERCNAVLVYSKDVQQDYGVSGQLTWLTSPKSLHNQFTVGATFDRGVVGFTQNTQYGYLNPDKTITGINAWEENSAVDLHGSTPNWSVYATDTLTLGRAWNATLSGRFNRNTIDNQDRLNPVPGPGSLNGSYVFNRFDPAIGLTYSPLSYLNLYASYTEGSRAPTSIELGCADPDNPCSLPNALASDPPLQQVVTGTWEAGLRGGLERYFKWNLGGFQAENKNDILFVASQQTGSGYFKNFARTRREGLQANLDGHVGRVSGGIDYTFLTATYQSVETLNGNANNTSDIASSGAPGLGGVITIQPGNRIPLVPKQTGKLFADIQVTPKLLVDFNATAASSSYARGNENNAYQADGKYYLGPGVAPGYFVANLAARYRLTKRLEVAAQVDNLFDRRYYTAAQLANTGFTAQGLFLARPFPAYTTGPQAGNYPLQSVTFYSPGAPRRAWVDLRIVF